MNDSALTVRLEAWKQADLSLLQEANTPDMMVHLGGPETHAKLLERHHRYLLLDDPAAGQMFAVVLPDGQRAGIIGYWERTWQQELVYETGWNIMPAFQGRGFATAAARAVTALARAQRRQRHLHAFPAADHPASNAVCRKAGFTLRGETDFEYPPGTIMRCNDWRLELLPRTVPSAACVPETLAPVPPLRTITDDGSFRPVKAPRRTTRSPHEEPRPRGGS